MDHKSHIAASVCALWSALDFVPVSPKREANPEALGDKSTEQVLQGKLRKVDDIRGRWERQRKSWCNNCYRPRQPHNRHFQVTFLRNVGKLTELVEELPVFTFHSLSS